MKPESNLIMWRYLSRKSFTASFLNFALLVLVLDARLYGPYDERLLEQESPGWIDVIVTLKDDCLLQEFADRLDFFDAKLNVKIHRTNSLALSISLEFLPLLELDACVAQVGEDPDIQSLSETIPWGIPVVLTENRNIPVPSPSGKCFKICVIDSGLFVDHPDIVSLQQLFAAR
jgi:hypothetical protein